MSTHLEKVLEHSVREYVRAKLQEQPDCSEQITTLWSWRYIVGNGSIQGIENPEPKVKGFAADEWRLLRQPSPPAQKILPPSIVSAECVPEPVIELGAAVATAVTVEPQEKVPAADPLETLLGPLAETCRAMMVTLMQQPTISTDQMLSRCLGLVPRELQAAARPLLSRYQASIWLGARPSTPDGYTREQLETLRDRWSSLRATRFRRTGQSLNPAIYAPGEFVVWPSYLTPRVLDAVGMTFGVEAIVVLAACVARASTDKDCWFQASTRSIALEHLEKRQLGHGGASFWSAVQGLGLIVMLAEPRSGGKDGSVGGLYRLATIEEVGPEPALIERIRCAQGALA